jgi:hypothetical protein
LIIVPPAPTAQPVLLSVKKTPLSWLVVPLLM